MPRPAKPKPSRKSGGKPSRGKPQRSRFRPLRWIRLAVLFFFASSVLAVLLFRFVPPPLTPLMAIRCLEDIVSGHLPKLSKDWTRLGKISPRLAEAVVASEDQLFFDHNGFDWEAIRSAFSVNGSGKRKIGASTITQQTAKNLFLWPDRSWARKGLEAYFTLLLELLWSKRRILEVYLNIIETGDGVYGAEAAALRYFQVPSARLTAPQAALIAAILPNPRVWSPANPTGYIRRRQTWILRQMDHTGPLPEGLSRVAGAPAPYRSGEKGLGGTEGKGNPGNPGKPSPLPADSGPKAGSPQRPNADPLPTAPEKPKSPPEDSSGLPFPEVAPGTSPDGGKTSLTPLLAPIPPLSPENPPSLPDTGPQPPR